MRTNSDVKKAMDRVVVLKSEGKSWHNIAQTLDGEGLRDARGNPFKADNLKAHYSKHMKAKRGTSQPPEKFSTEYDEHDGQLPLTQDEPCLSPAFIERAALPDKSDERDERYAEDDVSEDTPVETQMPSEWEERMKAIAREVFAEMIQGSHNTMNVMQMTIDGEEMPPKVEVIKHGGKGRKETRTYERLTVALDSVLAQLFKNEMRERRLSAGKLMDVILWNRYGKPRLSYESKGN